MTGPIYLQDETGASAILAEQLDTSMGGAPKQFREVQGSESPEFLQVWKSGLHLPSQNSSSELFAKHLVF